MTSTDISPIQQLLSRLNLGSKLIYGDPVQKGQVTVIPVAKLKVGFGYGQGKKPQAVGEGGGAAMVASPIGYIEIHEKKAIFKPIRSFTLKSVLLTAGLTSFLILKLFRSKQ